MAQEKTDERIKVKCGCGAQLTAPRRAAGKRVKCPRCRKALTVHTPGSSVDRLLYALSDDEYNKPPLEEQPVMPELEITERGTKLCPQCNSELTDTAVFCVNCGNHLTQGNQAAMGTASKDNKKGFLSRLFRRNK